MLGPDDAHKYLGRTLAGNVRKRNDVEFSRRLRCAWLSYGKHADVLLDQHVHIRQRMNFFQAVVTPTVLYGLSAAALTAQQLEKLDATQRQMLRNMVGWKRVPLEDWSDTMRRMRRKVDTALMAHPVKDWSEQHLRSQFRFACRVASRGGDWPARLSRWHPGESVAGAYRSRGRPPLRWDDRLSQFASERFNSASWPDAFTDRSVLLHEDAYVLFHRRRA